MGKRKGKGRQQGHVVTWAQAWRDVMQSAMARGLLIPITISIVLMIAAWRMPGEDVSSVAFSIIGGLKDHSLVGWALCVLLAVAWNWHARVMRRCFSAEAQRIGNEKTKYQQKQTARELGSSDK